MARTSRLQDPEFCKEVAAAFADGQSRDEVAAYFECDPSTATRWRKDPRVKKIISTMISDRVQRITAKTDAELERRLLNASELSIKELIDIRKELMGQATRAKLDQADNDTINVAAQAVDDDPQFMDDLRALLNRKAE